MKLCAFAQLLSLNTQEADTKRSKFEPTDLAIYVPT